MEKKGRKEEKWQGQKERLKGEMGKSWKGDKVERWQGEKEES